MIQLRRDTAANWTSVNPTLGDGQPGIETDTRQWKVGDGTTAWNSLGYMVEPFDGEAIDDRVAALAVAGTNMTITYDDVANTLTFDASGGGGGTLPDGDYGDITVSSTGTVMTIDNAAVTLAKMANMATASLIYRKTGGAGAPEINTLATLKTDLGLTGTNSGDQTITLTGKITGSGTGSFATSLGSFTKAELDTAVSDGNVLYVGDVTQYTDELAQDAVGAMVDASLVYTDATPLLQRAALTGDVTASAGSNATTLATVNANVGTFGSATEVAQITVNAKGLITAAANVTVTAATDQGMRAVTMQRIGVY